MTDPHVFLRRSGYWGYPPKLEGQQRLANARLAEGEDGRH